MKPPYRCLYNHELVILFTSETPYQSYRRPVGDDQVTGMVRELAHTQVDALMCCPTAWRAVLWPSDVDPRWRTEDLERVEPPRQGDLKYYEKAYWRMREYMIEGRDPVRLTRETARAIGLDFFFSYRMNDRHYIWNADCPTHDRLWRMHPELRFPDAPACLNYLHRDVRDYYLALLTELCERYEPEGLELDFMRSPRYVPDNAIEKGREVMTGFVEQVRSMLDRLGKARGHPLPLSVRVPRNIAECLKIGLDVPAWDRAGLINMVNASPFFIATPEIDVEGFTSALDHAAVYAELHFVNHCRVHPSGFKNNYLQKTTPIQYETLAHDYWARGADGISLFNFAYCREHSFCEPRRLEFPGVEPPFDVFKRITDREQLAVGPRHYVVNPYSDKLPRAVGGLDGAATVEILIADDLPPAARFCDAMLRVEFAEDCWRVPIEVSLNGQRLARSNFVGELFIPFTREALPAARKVEHYRTPVDILEAGVNTVTVALAPGTAPANGLTWQRLELALYVGDGPR